ncbi:MAG: winged helix-turn-helix domain-containing protein [Anaerolineae bacterium]|nr:winged helix-turn-helix domain-containing protein [Anaerolineae bacterium]
MGNAACCDFDKFLKAMASEIRQRILRLLSEREMCVTELYETLDIPQPTMSHHLGVLQCRRSVQMICSIFG